MDDVKAGRLLRALRRRKHLRQADLADLARLSQSAISLIERGHLSTLSLRTVRAVFSAVDARFDGVVSWRGGALDRLLDERHARLVGQFASSLARAGWEVQVEVTFAQYAERGSIDIVGLRRAEGVALVVEVKTELTAIDDTIRRLDVKDRLGKQIVFERFGWRPTTVGRVLVVLEGRPPGGESPRTTAHCAPRSPIAANRCVPGSCDRGVGSVGSVSCRSKGDPGSGSPNVAAQQSGWYAPEMGRLRSQDRPPMLVVDHPSWYLALGGVQRRSRTT